MARTGRPVGENSMRKIVTIRMNEEEYARITNYSQKSGKTLTQIVKEGIEKMYKQEPVSQIGAKSFPKKGKETIRWQSQERITKAGH